MRRAASRAASWTLRAILRNAVFGQHLAFIEHVVQSVSRSNRMDSSSPRHLECQTEGANHRCVEHVEAIGSRRANSPSWPCIESMPKSEAECTCAVGTGAKAKEACNEEESISLYRVAGVSVLSRHASANNPKTQDKLNSTCQEVITGTTANRGVRIGGPSKLSRLLGFFSGVLTRTEVRLPNNQSHMRIGARSLGNDLNINVQYP